MIRIFYGNILTCSNSFLRSLPQQPTVPVFATKSTYTVKYKNVVMDTSHIYADMHKWIGNN